MRLRVRFPCGLFFFNLLKNVCVRDTKNKSSIQTKHFYKPPPPPCPHLVAKTLTAAAAAAGLVGAEAAAEVGLAAAGLPVALTGRRMKTGGPSYGTGANIAATAESIMMMTEARAVMTGPGKRNGTPTGPNTM